MSKRLHQLGANDKVALDTDLPKFATENSAGIVKPDGTTTTVDENGVISAVGGGGTSGYDVTVVYHSGDGDSANGNAVVGGFDCRADENGLQVGGVNRGPSSPVVLHNQTMICVPPQTNWSLVSVNGLLRDNEIIQLTGDSTLDICYLYCLCEGTMVRLADGKEKAIEDITYDDMLAVWNFDDGKMDGARPAWIKRRDYVYYYWETTFQSGRRIRTCGVHGHRFFATDENRWIYADEIAGHRVATVDGEDVAVGSRLVKNVRVDFFNIITEGHINHYGNGVLCGCSLENGLYPVQDMRFVKDGRELRTYDEFDGEVPEDWFNACRYADSSLAHDRLVKYYRDRASVALEGGCANGLLAGNRRTGKRKEAA